MSMREIWKLSVVAVLMLAVCGCSRPNIIGADAAVYSRGNLYAVSEQDLNTVYQATLKAMQQLEVEVTEKSKDVFYAKIVGKVADGKTVTIRMEPGADNANATDLRIKASTFGNEDRARVIYDRIQQNLKIKSVRK
jgi:hypothetical protein